MTPDQRALLAAISAQPDDDTVRLAYADWLDERGEPGDGARAEFIRVQTELWHENVCPFTVLHSSDLVRSDPNKLYVFESGPKAKKPCGWCVVCKNKKRETELLAAHRDEWLRVECRALGPHHGDPCAGGRVQSPNAQFTQNCNVCGGAGDIGGLVPRIRQNEDDKGGFPFPDTTFARGFPHSVTARLADVFESYEADYGGIREPRWAPTALALRWFRHHPTLRMVRLADRPAPGRIWFRCDQQFDLATERDLPDVIFDRLEGGTLTRGGSESEGFRSYPTTEAATDALATAGADVIRAAVEKEPQS